MYVCVLDHTDKNRQVLRLLAFVHNKQMLEKISFYSEDMPPSETSLPPQKKKIIQYATETKG